MDTSHKVKSTFREGPQPQGGLQGWHSIPCAPAHTLLCSLQGSGTRLGACGGPPGAGSSFQGPTHRWQAWQGLASCPLCPGRQRQACLLP